MDNLDVPLDVMTYIASHIDNNVRELEGALTRVVAYASFKHYPVTNELAVDVLKNTITKQETTVKQVDKVINIALIQETVAKYFKLTLADLNGKKRNRNIAFPRQIAMYLAREMTDASLPRIGGNLVVETIQLLCMPMIKSKNNIKIIQKQLASLMKYVN